MSSSLISRSPDLLRLRNEGFNLEVRSGHLLVHEIPYVNAERQVLHGVLVIRLDLTADIAVTPGDHTAYFTGQCPCDAKGQPLNNIINNSQHQQLGPDLSVDHYFSAKPRSGCYSNYYEKLTVYSNLLCGHAQAIDPEATPRTFAPILSDPLESIFAYVDTASARAQIVVPTERLKHQKVAIVGLGGTGAYVLDLVSKTPISAIHLYDGDVLQQHNAFRYPGAVNFEILKSSPHKVSYLHDVYKEIHLGITPHPEMITQENAQELHNYDFVFVCVDSGHARRLISQALRGGRTTMIDVGMGVHLNANQEIFAVCRVSMIDPECPDEAEKTLPMSDADDGNLYSTNTQVGDLNCLNAFMAVEAWKKQSGFYAKSASSFMTTYTTPSSSMAAIEVGTCE